MLSNKQNYIFYKLGRKLVHIHMILYILIFTILNIHNVARRYFVVKYREVVINKLHLHDVACSGGTGNDNCFKIQEKNSGNLKFIILYVYSQNETAAHTSMFVFHEKNLILSIKQGYSFKIVSHTVNEKKVTCKCEYSISRIVTYNKMKKIKIFNIISIEQNFTLFG